MSKEEKGGERKIILRAIHSTLAWSTVPPRATKRLRTARTHSVARSTAPCGNTHTCTPVRTHPHTHTPHTRAYTHAHRPSGNPTAESQPRRGTRQGEYSDPPTHTVGKSDLWQLSNRWQLSIDTEHQCLHNGGKKRGKNSGRKRLFRKRNCDESASAKVAPCK